MDTSQIFVTIGGLALIGAVLVFFFGRRRTSGR
jgi:LPXTG-motif cell wall-anchored protein